MTQSKVDLIMHPVRMRVLMVIADKQMTTQQIAAALPDVSKASLYRHVSALVEGDILVVVEETQVRGTVERTYALASKMVGHLTSEEVANFSKDDHMRFFTLFATQLMRDFARYLDSRETLDFVADGVGYHTFTLYFSDEEIAEFSQALNSALTPYLEPGPGRKARRFSTVIQPDDINDDEE